MWNEIKEINKKKEQIWEDNLRMKMINEKIQLELSKK